MHGFLLFRSASGKLELHRHLCAIRHALNRHAPAPSLAEIMSWTPCGASLARCRDGSTDGVILA